MMQRPALRLVVLLFALGLAAASAHWLVSTDEWVPAGPFAEEPGMGQGSDWDRRWQWAMSAAVSRERGSFPHWDPFLNFGTPLFSEPESFLTHPAYAAVAPIYGMRSGMNAVYACNCFLLLLGLAWLGHRLRVPFPLAMASALFLLGSDEWFTRLGSGHPMVLGICLWPAAAAATLAAMDPLITRWEKRVLLASVAGLALGLAGLTGAHYPLSYGMLMVVLLTWASVASPRILAGVVGVCCIPLLVRGGPEWGRYILDLVAWTAVIVAVMRAGRWRDQLATLIGVGLGLLGTAGFFLVSAAERASQLGRLTVKVFHPPSWNTMPLEHLVQNGGDLESYLSFGHPAIWVALLAGLALCALRSPALAAVSAMMLALAWSLGLPLRPWELVSAVPGMAAADLQMRMQWIVLIMAPLGLATGFAAIAERLGGYRASWIACTVAAIAIVWFGADSYQLPADIERGQAPFEEFAEDPGRVRGLSPGWAASGEVYSRSPLRGLIIPIEYGDPSNFRELAVPDVAAGSMAWLSSGGELKPAPPEVRVDAVLNEWTIEGPPGAVVAVAQRDLPGWSCEGGELAPDLEYMRREREAGIFERDPFTGMWFLSVKIGQSGKAICTWTTPGLLKGILQQLLALVVLAVLALRLRKQTNPSLSDTPEYEAHSS
jgi:hypothetical protein